MKDKVITSWNILGIDFYSRERLSEKIIEFDFNERDACIYPGLHTVTQYPKLNFGLTLFEEIDWLLYSQRTIYLSILALIESGQIEVYQYKDKKSWLFSMINSNTTGYYLKTKERNHHNDFLTHVIFDEIKKSKSADIKYVDIIYQLESIVDFFLGVNEKHGEPAKEFLTQVFGGYDGVTSWFEIIKEKKALGLYSSLTTSIDSDELKKIKNNHTSYLRFSQKKAIEDLDIRDFRTKVFERINEDFIKREPSDTD